MIFRIYLKLKCESCLLFSHDDCNNTVNSFILQLACNECLNPVTDRLAMILEQKPSAIGRNKATSTVYTVGYLTHHDFYSCCYYYLECDCYYYSYVANYVLYSEMSRSIED